LNSEGLIQAMDRLTDLQKQVISSKVAGGPSNADDATLLDGALQRVRAGESVDAILADHRDAAADLRPSLELAGLLIALSPAPDPARSLAKARVRASVMAAAQQRLQRRVSPFSFSWLLRPAGFAMTAASVVFALGSGGAVVASASALPGEPLYAVKLAVEEARTAAVSASGDQSAQATLRASLAHLRVEEAATLVQRNKPLPPGVIDAAKRHSEKAELAAVQLSETQRAQAVPTLTAAHDQRTTTLNRLLTSGDLPLPAQTAIAGALELERGGRERLENKQARAGGSQRDDSDEKRNDRAENTRDTTRGQGQPDNRGQDNRSAGSSANRGIPVVPPVVVQRPVATVEANNGNSSNANRNASDRGGR